MTKLSQIQPDREILHAILGAKARKFPVFFPVSREPARADWPELRERPDRQARMGPASFFLTSTTRTTPTWRTTSSLTTVRRTRRPPEWTESQWADPQSESNMEVGGGWRDETRRSRWATGADRNDRSDGKSVLLGPKDPQVLRVGF